MNISKQALGAVAVFDPPKPRAVVGEDQDGDVSFVKMASVSAETGTITVHETRRLQEVLTGFTYFQDFDILVAKITPCFENGKIAQARIPHVHGFGSTEFHVIRADRAQLDARYLLHFLRLPHVRLAGERRMTGSAGQRRVPRNFLETLRIPMCSLEEQRRIAAILDQAEALRTKRHQALAKLDTLTQSLFLEMFGKPNGDMEIWPTKHLSEIIHGFESGKSLVADDEDEQSSCRVLKVSAVSAFEYNPNEAKPIPLNYKPPREHFVHSGEVLISRANTAELVGSTAFVWETPKNRLLPDKLWRFVWQKEPIVTPLFIAFLFRQPYVRQQIARSATGTSGSMKNISMAKIFRIRINVPPLELQLKFSNLVEVLRANYRSSSISMSSLNSIFASLQHRAFNGEL